LTKVHNKKAKKGLNPVKIARGIPPLNSKTGRKLNKTANKIFHHDIFFKTQRKKMI
jgi:hypothetical protein